jgi:hypothetical protein
MGSMNYEPSDEELAEYEIPEDEEAEELDEDDIEDEDREIESVPTLQISKLKDIDDTAEEWIYIKDWDCKVRIRAISAHQLHTIQAKCGPREGKNYSANMQKFLFIAGVVEPAFDENSYRLVLGKKYSNVEKIIDAIMKVSNLKGEKAKATTRERRFPRRR